MPKWITVGRISAVVILSFSGFGWAMFGSHSGNPQLKVAAFLGVALVAGALIMAAIWHDWFSHPLTNMPKRSHSHSLSRHSRGQAAMAKWFRAYATGVGALPDPPKPAAHDPAFLAAWQAGDLGECDRRLDLLAGEMDRREGPEVARLMHYQRCLERARKAAWAATRPDARTGSILDEVD